MKVQVFLVCLLAGLTTQGDVSDSKVVPAKSNPLYYTPSIGVLDRGGILTIGGEILQDSTNVCPKSVLLTVRFLDASSNCCGVGGLPRTQALPNEPGYVYLPSRRGVARFEEEVSIPTNAVSAEIGFCAWSNPSPVRITAVKFAMSSVDGDDKSTNGAVIPPKKKPLYYTPTIEVANRGGSMTIKGEILQDSTNVCSKAALVMVRFLDASGNCCGCGGLPRTPIIPTKPGYVYLPSKRGVTRFEEEVHIPTNAVSAEIGFCKWSNHSSMRIKAVRIAMNPPLENMAVVRLISWSIRHYKITCATLAGIIGSFLVLFCWMYRSAKKQMFLWLNSAIAISFILVGWALIFAVTDGALGLLIVVMLGLLVFCAKRLSYCFMRDMCIVVFSVGVILRLVAVFSIQMTPFSDFLSFWNQIVEWSKLHFVGTKSYPAVAVYSLLIGTFGEHYVVVGITNTILGALQMWLAKDVAARIFKNPDCGTLACAFIGLNPILIMMTPVVGSEIIYGTLILTSLWLFLRLYDEVMLSCKWKVMILALIVSSVAMMTMFARGNGAGIIPAGCCTIAILSLRLRRFKPFLRYVFSPLCLGCAVMIGVMCVITNKTMGYVCPTGANHQKWVYLQGSNIEYRGDGTMPDNALIRDLYAKAYPGKPFRQKDADPIIMEQFKKRWVENTPGEVALSLKKHYWVVRSNGIWAYWINTNKDLPISGIRTLLMKGISVLRSVMVMAFFVGSVWLFLKRRFDCAERALFALLFFLSNVVMTFITVWTPRYSYTMWIVLPIMASVFMTLVERREECACVNNGDFQEGR